MYLIYNLNPHTSVLPSYEGVGHIDNYKLRNEKLYLE
jgi:hypothetical protein